MSKYRFSTTSVTLLGAGSNILLSIIKIYGGLVGNSHGLISDGVHSLADLITDFVVLLAARFSTQKADNKYPYGYARIETLATVALAILLVLTGLGIMYHAAQSLFTPGAAVRPSIFVIYIAVFALIIKEILFRFTLIYGKKFQSPLLVANAWHHRSDAAASLVVVAGIIGALFGYVHLDDFAAIIVGIMIIKMGWELTFTSVKELIDVGLDPTMIANLQKCTLSAADVRSIHQLRTRLMGGRVLLDMHILVSPHLSVSEGHYIAARVHRELMRAMPNITDVTIHVDPEDDEEETESVLDLPPREKFIPLLQQRWGESLTPEVYKKIKLDYLAGKISITVKLPLDKIQNAQAANEFLHELKTKAADLTYVNRITLAFEIAEKM